MSEVQRRIAADLIEPMRPRPCGLPPKRRHAVLLVDYLE